MLAGKPIFPGTSTLNQLDRIMEVTGRPTAEDIESVQSSLAATMLDSLPPTKARKLHEVFPMASDDGLDFIRNTLHFNPSKRLTIEQCLAHPYVSQFHSPEDEPSCPYTIKISMDDNTKFSIREYRDKLYQEITKRKKELRKRIGASGGHNYYKQKYY